MIGNVNVPGALAADIANKVDKISGKGLSTNDFTNEYKSKLDNIATGGVSGEDINDLKAMVLPKLALTGTPNTDFNLTKDQTVIEGTISAGGSSEILIPELGTWSLSYEYGGVDFTKNVDILAPMTLNTTDLGFVSVSLATDSWAVISALSATGNASNYYSIGDEKDIELTTGEVLTLQIYDFNHDDLTAGGKAGITFGLKNLMADTRKMNNTHTNDGGFAGSPFYPESLMYTWLQGDLYNSLPADLKSVIKVVDKKTSAGRTSSTINTDSMKIFLFSEVECFGTTYCSVSGEGSQYPIFTDITNRSKKLSNGSGSTKIWWFRSPYNARYDSFCCLEYTGGGSSNFTAAGYPYGVCFGFCV